ncbi:MAG: DNA methyltransferase [Candidatus Nanoarchaeia archaeon]
MDYMFILGRDSELSLLELVSYFKNNSITYRLVWHHGEVAVFSLPQLDFKKIITQLGGAVKIGVVMESLDDLFFDSNRVKYAVSAYGKADVHEFKKLLKAHFRSQHVRAFQKKPKKGNVLMPSDVLHHDLIDSGYEFILGGDFFARTIAVFDPSEHESRDEQRPEKDYLNVISIRLAKILINLSQPKHTLLDPFCGYGTILQEALLMGLDVFGIDLDPKIVNACKKNLLWLQNNYEFKGRWRVFCNDARNSSKILTSIDSIATEPYLGPFLKKLPSKEEASKIASDLSVLYSDVLTDLRKVVKGKIAIVIPRFRTRANDLVSLPFERIVKESGFKPVNFSEVKLPVLYLTGKIEREIWVLE